MLAPQPYRIADEPALGRWQGWAVDPSWPLVGLMLAGAWLAWPWLWLNSAALGSPTARQERAWIAAGLVGSAALGAIVLALVAKGALRGPVAVQVALLGITAWKLGAAAAVHRLQARTLPRFVGEGGEAQSGLGALLVAIFVGRALVLGFCEEPLWGIVVGGGI